MSRLFFYCLIICAVFAAGINAQVGTRCTKINEVYTRCGKPCDLVCPGTPRPCIMVCESGCICKPGYARSNKNGVCIPISRCPKY